MLPVPKTVSTRQIFESQQANRFKTANADAKERIKKLKRLYDAMMENKQGIRDALYADFKKSAAETDVTELYTVINEIRHVVANLKDWMEPKSVGVTLALLGSESYIQYEAKGLALIIAPWNYPVNLSIGPLVSAIAAGNNVIVKPSELTPHSSAIVAKIISQAFSPNEVAVIQGGVEVSQELLALPFDHIFFTGSPRVGKIVMKAAAENLTSVTLELGGKSPVVVDETANIVEAAKKTVWGKFANCGQTCIAPDYLFVHESKAEELIGLMKENIAAFYGNSEEDRKNSPDLARLVDNGNFNRVNGLLQEALEKGAVAEIGGFSDPAQRYVAPTLLTNVPHDARILKEEIFGPILPIMTYKTIGEVLEFINAKEKPLALYIFSKNQHQIETLMNYTSSGGACINDVNVHFFENNLPFGGVNNSGIGKAHGHHGFLAFSNEKGVLKQPTRYSVAQLMYPPYNAAKQTLIDFTINWV